MTDTEKPEGPNDFLDFIKYGLSLLFRFFDFINSVFRKKRLLIFCLGLLGLGCGYLRYAIRKPEYIVSMQLYEDEMPKRIFADKLREVNDLLKSQSFRSVSEKLHISGKLARDINIIEAENIMSVPLEKDTSSRGVFFVIAELSDNRGIDTLQSALIAYLNDLDYPNVLKKVRQDIYREKKQFIDRQLAQLDSFKTVYSKSLAEGNTGSINLTLSKNDVTELYKQANSMRAEQDYLTEQLSHDKIVHLLDGFSVPEHPKRHSLLLNLLVFALAGIMAGFIIGVFQILKSEIRSW